MEYPASITRLSIVGYVALALSTFAIPLLGGTPGMLWFYAPIGLGLLLHTLHSATYRLILRPDRVEKRTILGSQSVRFADVKVIDFDVINYGRNVQVETIRLVSSGRDFVFSPKVSGFEEIRTTLVECCPQAKVQDCRPAKPIK